MRAAVVATGATGVLAVVACVGLVQRRLHEVVAVALLFGGTAQQAADALQQEAHEALGVCARPRHRQQCRWRRSTSASAGSSSSTCTGAGTSTSTSTSTRTSTSVGRFIGGGRVGQRRHRGVDVGTALATHMPGQHRPQEAGGQPLHAQRTAAHQAQHGAHTAGGVHEGAGLHAQTMQQRQSVERRRVRKPV